MSDRLVKNQELIEGRARSWVKIHNFLSFLGRGKKGLYEYFDHKFGPENWAPAHFHQGKVISRYHGYLVYEESYYQAFKNDPSLRQWIVNTASEVYDNAPSNPASGLDYCIQETEATHLQDISVRRALTRLALEEGGQEPDPDNLPAIPLFKGTRLVQIRDKDSEGFRLNPGQVPFHQPSELPPFKRKSWWLPGSVEDWYQKAKVLLINPEALKLEPALLTWRGVYLAWEGSFFLSMDPGDPLNLCAAKKKDLYAALETGALGRHTTLVNRVERPFEELVEIARRYFQRPLVLDKPHLHMFSFMRRMGVAVDADRFTQPLTALLKQRPRLGKELEWLIQARLKNTPGGERAKSLALGLLELEHGGIPARSQQELATNLVDDNPHAAMSHLWRLGQTWLPNFPGQRRMCSPSEFGFRFLILSIYHVWLLLAVLDMGFPGHRRAGELGDFLPEELRTHHLVAMIEEALSVGG